MGLTRVSVRNMSWMHIVGCIVDNVLGVHVGIMAVVSL